MRLDLLTFNTLGTPFFAPGIAKRYKKTAEFIASTDIDIVAFQEIFSHYNKALLDRWMKQFPYRVYKPFALGLYGGLAIYSKIPLTFESFHVYAYPKGMFVPPYTRLAHSGILVAKFRDTPMRLVTTHLSSDVVHNLTPHNRFYNLISSQLEQAIDLFSELSKKEQVIMTGDFNISNLSGLYTSFIERTKAHDVFKGDTEPSYKPDRIPYIYPAQTSERIDYIFYKGKSPVKVLQKERMFVEKETDTKGRQFYLSDHMGLRASLDINF
jgi:endonuclease/exonuclease/phosphatase family metal-dependent hydrolase